MFTYEILSGIFRQSQPQTIADTFDYARDFGLIPQAVADDDSRTDIPEWQNLTAKLRLLNEHAPRGVRYKILFLGRHGQGFHNVAESEYGTNAWDDYWSKLDGTDKVHWADARLTDTGRQQALTAHDTWKRAIASGLPPPDIYYCSPLDRCLETATLTFEGLHLPRGRQFVPHVKELLREVLGVHTCDRRSDKTITSARFPNAEFEPGFHEKDTLWQEDHRETNTEQEIRLRKLLDDVLEDDSNTFVSLTSHSGAIRAILAVIGHRPFALRTGAVIPVALKLTRSKE